MNIKDIKKLRKKLPAHYAKELSERLVNINPTEVSRVFNGEITRSTIVNPVISEALSFLAEQKVEEEKLAKALAEL